MKLAQTKDIRKWFSDFLFCACRGGGGQLKYGQTIFPKKFLPGISWFFTKESLPKFQISNTQWIIHWHIWQPCILFSPHQFFQILLNQIEFNCVARFVCVQLRMRKRTSLVICLLWEDGKNDKIYRVFITIVFQIRIRQKSNNLLFRYL